MEKKVPRGSRKQRWAQALVAARAARIAQRAAARAHGAAGVGPAPKRLTPAEEDAAALERLRVASERREVRPPWLAAEKAELETRMRALAMKELQLAKKQRRAEAALRERRLARAGEKGERRLARVGEHKAKAAAALLALLGGGGVSG